VPCINATPPNSLNVGDEVIFASEHKGCSIEYGARARITRGTYFKGSCWMVDVLWLDARSHHQGHGGYLAKHFILNARVLPYRRWRRWSVTPLSTVIAGPRDTDEHRQLELFNLLPEDRCAQDHAPQTADRQRRIDPKAEPPPPGVMT